MELHRRFGGSPHRVYVALFEELPGANANGDALAGTGGTRSNISFDLAFSRTTSSATTDSFARSVPPTPGSEDASRILASCDLRMTD
jgi:hypothetical protein